MEEQHINQGITVHLVTSEDELHKVHQIRQEVFIVEQNVEESLEYEFEDESNHFIAYADGQPAGTARWRETSNGIKLERFAVLGSFRNKGIGSALLSTILAHLPSATYVYLHAQLPAMNLYAKQGFMPEGDLFYEADMPHYKMKLSQTGD